MSNKIYVGGRFSSLNGNTRNKLVRLNLDGTEDTTFNTNLGTGFNADIFRITVLQNEQVYIGGGYTTFNGNTRNRLVRLNPDGTEDTAFYSNLGTGFNQSVFDVKIQSDDKIIIGGVFTSFNGNTRNKLIRLNSDYSEDTAFYSNLGTGFNSNLYTIAIQSDGKILIGGAFTVFNGNTRNRLVRLNSDGTEDTAFYTNLGTGFDAGPAVHIRDIRIQLDGKIVIFGDFDGFNGNVRNGVIRLNSDGTEDTAFNTNVAFSTPPIVWAGDLQSDGKMPVGGNFNIYDGNTRNYLIRLNSDGTEDTAFYSNLGTAFNDTVRDVAINNKILVGGEFTTFDGNTRNNLVQLNTDGTEDTAFYTNLGTGFNDVVLSFGFGTYIEPLQPCSSSLYTFNAIDERYNHNLGTKYIVANIYESGGVGIFPNSLTAYPNYVDFDFGFTTVDGWITVKEANYSQSFSSQTSVNVSHSLNTEDVIVQTFDQNGELFIANSVSISGSNNVIVDFGIPLSGYVTVLEGIYTKNFTSVTESIASHSFGNQNQLIGVYDSTGEQIIPDTIQILNDNETKITFGVPTTGKAVFDRVCADIPPQTEIFIGSDTVTESVSTCIPVTVGDGFENVLTWQGTIQYNSILLDFVSESNDNLGITLFEPISGSLTFSWISPYLTGSTFSSGSTLFELCFDTTGSGLARLQFTGSPTLLEMSDESGSIFDVTYYTGSITVLEATSSTENVTLYLYETSSEAEFFDIYYGQTPTGPWYLAESGSNVNLYADYSYTLPVLSGSNYLKVVNKNPTYFPDNFKIHDLNFGEPSKGTTPAPTPIIATQSLEGEILVVNNGSTTLGISDVRLWSGSVTASCDEYVPGGFGVLLAAGNSHSFTIPNFSTSGSQISFPAQINLSVLEVQNTSDYTTCSFTVDEIGADLYPTVHFSGSEYTTFDGINGTIMTYLLDVKPSINDESILKLVGTASISN